MRLLMLALIITATVAATAQCPIQPRAAFVDAAGKSLTIRYYNAGPRIVRDVHFIVKTGESGREIQPVMANFAARLVLRPKKESQQVFLNPTNLSGNSGLEVQVWHVSFVDSSTWTAPRESPCKISLSRE